MSVTATNPATAIARVRRVVWPLWWPMISSITRGGGYLPAAPQLTSPGPEPRHPAPQGAGLHVGQRLAASPCAAWPAAACSCWIAACCRSARTPLSTPAASQGSSCDLVGHRLQSNPPRLTAGLPGTSP